MSVAHHVPAKNYVINFFVLMILMIATVVAARFDFGGANLPIALAIAITKTACIVLFFMNVRYGSPLVRVFAAGGFFWLCIMLAFTLSDYLLFTNVMGSPTTVAIP